MESNIEPFIEPIIEPNIEPNIELIIEPNIELGHMHIALCTLHYAVPGGRILFFHLQELWKTSYADQV